MEKARSDRSLGVDHDVEHYIDNFLAEEEVLRLLRQPSALDRDKSSSRGSPLFFDPLRCSRTFGGPLDQSPTRRFGPSSRL